MIKKMIIILIYILRHIGEFILKSNKISKPMGCVIFSKDRPIQLNATIESYFLHCDDPVEIKVIYRASNEMFRNGYKDLIKIHANKKVEFVQEINFRNNLISVLNLLNTKLVFFLVDDIIFKSKFSHKSFLDLKNSHNYILSLRLGENLNYCYPSSSSQELPKFKYIGKKFNSWSFRKSNYDWGYTFSVDGHIYNLIKIKNMTKSINFSGPNSYESNMNIFKHIFYLQKGLCYKNSKLVNVSLNRVQNEIDNISGHLNPEELNLKWINNYKIDLNQFIDKPNKSAHMEIDNLIFERRT